MYENYEWTQEELWKLRQEVRPGSVYGKDYENSFGVLTDNCYYFFESYLEYLGEEMEYQIDDYDDSQYWDYIEEFDTPENLYEYWYGIEDPNINPITKMLIEYVKKIGAYDKYDALTADIETAEDYTTMDEWTEWIEGLEDGMSNIRDYDYWFEDEEDDEKVAEYQNVIADVIDYLKRILYIEE